MIFKLFFLLASILLFAASSADVLGVDQAIDIDVQRRKGGKAYIATNLPPKWRTGWMRGHFFDEPDLPLRPGFILYTSFGRGDILFIREGDSQELTRIDATNIGTYLDEIKNEQECKAVVKILQPNLQLEVIGTNAIRLIIEDIPIAFPNAQDLGIKVVEPYERAIQGLGCYKTNGIWKYSYIGREGLNVIRFSYDVDSTNNINVVKSMIVKGVPSPQSLFPNSIPVETGTPQTDEEKIAFENVNKWWRYLREKRTGETNHVGISVSDH